MSRHAKGGDKPMVKMAVAGPYKWSKINRTQLLIFRGELLLVSGRIRYLPFIGRKYSQMLGEMVVAYESSARKKSDTYSDRITESPTRKEKKIGMKLPD